MFYEFTAKLWRRSEADKASRYFVTVEQSISDQIKQYALTVPKSGRGLKVSVRIAYITWKTSIFRDKKSSCYVLPMKAEIRKKLSIDEGDQVAVSLTIL